MSSYTCSRARVVNLLSSSVDSSDEIYQYIYFVLYDMRGRSLK